MSDENDFGTLRSLLAAPTRDHASFDDVMRHLTDWSWHDDPRILERWLGYAEAHIGRWPDAARCLDVRPEDEIFLRDIFRWSSLFRSVRITRAPKFLARFVDAVAEQRFAHIRHLYLHFVEPTGAQGAALAAGLTSLEGISLAKRWGETSALVALNSIFGLQCLRWLDLGGARVSDTDLQRFLDVNGPLELFIPSGHELTDESAGALRMLGAGRALRALYVGHANGNVLNILFADVSLRDDLTLGFRSTDGLYPSDHARIEERGWEVVTDDGWLAVSRELTDGALGH